MLTDYMIATFRPRAKPYTYTDGRGLFLLMTPIGSKLWRFSYRFDGKQHTIAGGSYPEVSIVLARVWRDAMRQQLASGINPAEERWKQKRMGSFSRRAIVLRSFEQAARAWIETRRPGWSKRYEAFITGRLEVDIFLIVGKQEISRITLEDIRKALRNIEA